MLQSTGILELDEAAEKLLSTLRTLGNDDDDDLLGDWAFSRPLADGVYRDHQLPLQEYDVAGGYPAAPPPSAAVATVTGATAAVAYSSDLVEDPSELLVAEELAMLEEAVVHDAVADRVLELERELVLAREHSSRLEEELQQVRDELLRRTEELDTQSAIIAGYQAASAEARTTPHTPHRKASRFAMDEELRRLKAQVHEKTWALHRLEAEQEKDMDGYTSFLTRLSSSSAGATLGQHLDMETLNILGMGNYGFVMSGIEKATGDSVVLKLLSPRWVRVAVEEWMHGSEMGKHPNIVDYHEVLMHRDSDKEIQRRLIAGFEDGSLKGRRPKLFPDCFICLILEYMDRGTVQGLVDRRMITVEGMAAVARQVATALAYMHSHKRTHNDIKPENILLRQAPANDGDHLIVKLADLGLADHSVDRRRDMELFGYTMWCVGLGRQFTQCPTTAEAQAKALGEFKDAPWAGENRELHDSLTEVVGGVWQEKLTLESVANMAPFKNCELRVPKRRSSVERALQEESIATLARREGVAHERWQRNVAQIRAATRVVHESLLKQCADAELDMEIAGIPGLISMPRASPRSVSDLEFSDDG